MFLTTYTPIIPSDFSKSSLHSSNVYSVNLEFTCNFDEFQFIDSYITTFNEHNTYNNAICSTSKFSKALILTLFKSIHFEEQKELLFELEKEVFKVI